jgi:hypothetical protein
VLCKPHVDGHLQGVRRLVKEPRGVEPRVALIVEVYARLLDKDGRRRARALPLLRDVRRDDAHLCAAVRPRVSAQSGIVVCGPSRRAHLSALVWHAVSAASSASASVAGCAVVASLPWPLRNAIPGVGHSPGSCHKQTRPWQLRRHGSIVDNTYQRLS